ncbi:MAG: ABC transporter ATP-binding protein, partial [Cellulomonas sp.]
MRHGPMMAGGMPAEKSMDFRGSGRRLLGVLRPERAKVAGVMSLAVASVSLVVLGPKILGTATNIIFEGVIGKQLPAGITQQQAIDAARAQGQNTFADLLSGMTVVPGAGIDFDRLGRILLAVLAIYIGSFVFGWLQGRMTTGVVQRTTFRLRADVEAKLSRVPLRYFDRQQRGEVLSRVTNDIDNIAQTMQQTLSQLITSALTIIGVIVMMFWISPLLAVVALVTVPLSIVITVAIAKRSQPQFVSQWAWTGKLNAHVEEMYTGHALVKVFGRQKQAIATFHEQNGELYAASFKAQFISGIIQPAM